jgi:hypothetical protein
MRLDRHVELVNVDDKKGGNWRLPQVLLSGN